MAKSSKSSESAGFNKKDLTERLSKKAGIPKTKATQYINLLTGIISDALVSGKKVTISDFGTFNLSHRSSFKGYNSQNKKNIAVPERVIPVFRAGKRLKNALNLPLIKDCALTGVKQIAITFSKPIDPKCAHALQKSKYKIFLEEQNLKITSIDIYKKSKEGIESIKISTKTKVIDGNISVAFSGTLKDNNGNESEGELHWP